MSMSLLDDRGRQNVIRGRAKYKYRNHINIQSLCRNRQHDHSDKEYGAQGKDWGFWEALFGLYYMFNKQMRDTSDAQAL